MSSSGQISGKSPWASINDVLIQNKCWLCLSTFPKGGQKHVFEVSDLLTFYHNQHKRTLASAKLTEEEDAQKASSSEETANTEAVVIGTEKDFKFTSNNLQNCYDRYVALMVAGEDKPDKLFEEFKANDVEVWMSGLVCGGTAECRQELAYFIENKQHAAGGGQSSADKKKVNEMFSFAIPSGTGCPPGCNCEPSWPFMP